MRDHCLDIIRKDYYDYGPTLAAEKLCEYNECKISKNLLVRHKNCTYKLILLGKGYRLRQAGVLVCEIVGDKINAVLIGCAFNLPKMMRLLKLDPVSYGSVCWKRRVASLMGLGH